MSPRATWVLTFLGWVFFTLSAVFFTVGAARSGSVVELVASLWFLAACVLFMIPAIVNRPRRE